jgi:hypothetical protein
MSWFVPGTWPSDPAHTQNNLCRIGPVGQFDAAEGVVMGRRKSFALLILVRVAEEEVDFSAVLVAPAEIGSVIGQGLLLQVVRVERASSREGPSVVAVAAGDCAAGSPVIAAGLLTGDVT